MCVCLQESVYIVYYSNIVFLKILSSNLRIERFASLSGPLGLFS